VRKRRRAAADDEIADAAAFERDLQERTQMRASVWLHKERQPIDEVVVKLRASASTDMSLIDSECSGHCHTSGVGIRILASAAACGPRRHMVHPSRLRTIRRPLIVPTTRARRFGGVVPQSHT
jgi:hypothetical protein